MAFEWDFEYVLCRLLVGDSFFVPCLDTDKVRREIMRAAEEVGIKVSVRLAVEGELQGLRAWRVRVK